MYIINNIAHANEFTDEIELTKIDFAGDMVLLLTFTTGETRLFDAFDLLKYPAFSPLENQENFKTAAVENGYLTWLDGDIDIATETLYKNSYDYQRIINHVNTF